ncbi:MAG: hypothetical protein H0T91_03065, partial [Propionibacteriaceae bacterium]|nr:hypothetical protein [Propionibacteriaceae bacterium]
MSSVDPHWPPPAAGQHRPHKVAYVFAIVMPLVLLLAIAAPLAVTWGIGRLRSPDRAADAPAASSADEGQPGVGDPYFLDYGSSGYDAVSYAISIKWDADDQTMTSTTVMSARAKQRLNAFWFDLALTTDRVSVNGQPASFAKSGFQDVQVTPAEPIAAGTDFQVSVDYSGAPGRIKRGKTSAWWTTGSEWTAAGEPESSAWWFPANDHPSDPALMDVMVQVPADMEAISVGRLESVSRGRVQSDKTGEEANVDTWHWVSRQPMATYLNFVSIGQYELDRGMVDGRPYVYAVSEQLS